MVRFDTCILKFNEHGDKTGWTYIRIPAAIAQELIPGNKKSFRVKGRLDSYKISGVSLLPMGEGDFIMPLNATFRKNLRKSEGANLMVQLEIDHALIRPSAEFLECMQDEPAALEFFQTLPQSHQHYFIKWIDAAKTDGTRARRISRSVSALARKLGYSEMMRMASDSF